MGRRAALRGLPGSATSVRAPGAQAFARTEPGVSQLLITGAGRAGLGPAIRSQGGQEACTGAG